ncbi:protein kinase [Dyella sp. 2RAF44]|uniref:serine/threonine-protein kinase n=1 Tax=Dyella sp. 2RAF44 TaxID=3233000 RepID=UPI003F8D92E3
MLAALELRSEERAAFLHHTCSGDIALAAEVEWLMQAAEATSVPAFLSYHPLEEVRTLPDGSVSPAAPVDYRIERLLGEGGMGTVYLAERTVDGGTDGEVRQQVALKLLHNSGSMGVEARSRFADERRILASLNHPNIAHLLDAGRTADGSPYLAMEFVDGERIDRWCEQRCPELGERLSLFLQVCEAVQYAHGRLIIHRDIKPANILVTADGKPKLLDFGIARLLDETSAVADARTATMQRALTLAYASPEQVRGLPLDVTADVWSLGVVLYQLLSNTKPFGGGDTSPLDLANAIVAAQVLPPSRHAKAGMPIPTDLDAIVMKAMRRDPAERYASVAELILDVRRFLEARPVQARQGRLWYRWCLFVRRHRAALAASMIVLFSLVAFIATLAVQLRQVQKERDKTQAIAAFMADLFENADPTHARGETVSVREVLDRGAERISGDKTIAADVKAALLFSIGRSYNALDQSSRAIPTLQRALALQESYGATALDRGRTWAALGRAYGQQTDAAHALEADSRAMDLLAAEPGLDPGELLTLRTHALQQHASAGDMPAEQIVGRLRTIVDELATQRPPLREVQVQTLTTLSLALSQAGQNTEAVARARQALQIAEGFYGRNDPALLRPIFILAVVTAPSDPASAAELYERAIAERTRMLGASGPGMSTLHGYLGLTLASLGQHERAASALQRAYALSQAEPSPRPDFQDNVLTALANEYLELGRYRDAVNLLQPHVATFTQQAASGSAWALTNEAEALNILGIAAMYEGRLDDARQLYARMPEIADSAARQGAWMVATDGSGLLTATQHRFDEAARTLARFDAFNRRTSAPVDADSTLNARLLQARLAMGQGNAGQAESIASAAYAIAAGRRDACARLARELYAAWRDAAKALGRDIPSLNCPRPVNAAGSTTAMEKGR